ncbi:hypothetical protein BGZ73_001517 [Actinomortierella ambigua]|nr:hypothetical protein BGZ73_001517 [Actinomortierella ambigua]
MKHFSILASIEEDHISMASSWVQYSSLQRFFICLSLFLYLFCFTAAACALAISRSRYTRRERSKSSRLPKETAPGVTIIRPLRGLDCNLYENLASSFRQDYPKFEIVFSVAHANDPALVVVHDLMKKYPKVDARIIIGEKVVGINPKINNMVQSYETAKYDTVWVLDSNVYVDPGCMGRSMDKMMQPGVGLVHHLPFGIRPQSLGSELELMFLNSVHAKMYLFINMTGLASCVVGKSNLYRKSDLDKVGGLAAFGKYMAEDNLVATAIFNMGYKHEMTSDLAYQSLGSMTPTDYFLRRSRWTRIRKYTVTAATVVEPFIEMLGCGLVASYGFNMLWQTHVLNFLAFHFVTWFLVDLSLYQALSTKKIDNLRGFLMAWTLRELAAPPLFVYAVVGSTVDWRDQAFVLKRDGTVEAIPGSNTKANSDFWSKVGNSNVVPRSTQATLRKFFRHPAVISLVRSVMAVLYFLVDILIKSQRNGNNEDGFLEGGMDDSLGSGSAFEDLPEYETLKKQVGRASRSGRSSTSSSTSSASASSNSLRKRASKGNSGSSGVVVQRKSARLEALQLKREQELLMQHKEESMATDGGLIAVSGRANTSKSSSSNSRGSSRVGSAASSPVSDCFEDLGEEEEDEEYDDVMTEEERVRLSQRRMETEAEHGRRSTDEDALSKAIEPYLSDSMSRRGKVYHTLPSEFRHSLEMARP